MSEMFPSLVEIVHKQCGDRWSESSMATVRMAVKVKWGNGVLRYAFDVADRLGVNARLIEEFLVLRAMAR